MSDWLPVPGYEGLYEVSDQGQVRSVDRIDTAGNRRKGVLRKLYRNEEDGCVTVALSSGGKVKTHRVHTLVLTAHVGPSPSIELECCHNNGDWSYNFVENLRWDTSGANKLDTVRHGNHHMASKLLCINGHRLAGGNLVPSALRRTGQRQCLACDRARSAVRRHPELDFDEYAAQQYAKLELINA